MVRHDQFSLTMLCNVKDIEDDQYVSCYNNPNDNRLVKFSRK